MFAILWGFFPFMGLLGQPPDVVGASKDYLWLMAASLPFVMVIVCFRNFSEAQDMPWPAFWAGLAAVVLNIFLNWVFIYGNLGAPRMELEGAGLATWLARAFNLVLLISWLRLDSRFRKSWPGRWLARISMQIIKRMLRLGIPVSMQLLMEIGAFSGTILLMGWLGIVEMAAHQIAITCAATTFMVPLGLSLAVAIRVGHAIGGDNPERARIIGFGAFALSAFLSFLFACVFILLDTQLAGIFTKDPATLQMAASLLVIAGLFQFFDGGQVLAIGALRGCKDVRIPTGIVFLAYWIVAIPFGSLLAFHYDWGAQGLWTGLAVGLGFAAIGLIVRFERLTR
jgi:MATE family multidrug resistance protein